MPWTILLYSILSNAITIAGVVWFKWTWSSIFQFYIIECYVLTIFDAARLPFAKRKDDRASGVPIGSNYQLPGFFFVVMMFLCPVGYVMGLSLLFPSVEIIPWRTFLPAAQMLLIINGLKFIQDVFVQQTTRLDNPNEIMALGFARLVIIMATLLFAPLVFVCCPVLGLNAVVVTMILTRIILEIWHWSALAKKRNSKTV